MEKLIKPVKVESKSRYEVRVSVNGRNIGIAKDLVTVTRAGEITHAVQAVVDAYFKENSIEALMRIVAKLEAEIELAKSSPEDFDDPEWAIERAKKRIAHFKKAIQNNGVF